MMKTSSRTGSGKIHPLYCLVGEDMYQKLLLLRDLKKKILPRGEESLNYEYLLGDDSNAARILDAARTAAWGLFSASVREGEGINRLVVVDQAEKISPDDWKRMSDYLSHPDHGTCLVFLVNRKSRGWSPPTSFPKKYVRIFSPLKGEKLLAWARKEASGQGLTVPEEVMEELVRATGNNLGTIAGELEKLSLYKGGGGMVTLEEVRALVGTGQEGSIFNLTGLIVSGKADQSLKLLDRLLDEGEAPLKILSLIVGVFRKLWRGIDAWEETRDPRTTCEKAGVRFYQSEYLSQIRKIKSFDIPYCYRRLVETDEALKGGEKVPRLALERLIIDLSSPGG